MNISKYRVYVTNKKNGKVRSKSLALANLLVTELANYGVSVNREIHTRISKLKPKKAKAVVSEILSEYTVGKLNRPLFKNWEQREEFTFGEVVVQILGYLFQFSGNDLYDPDYMPRLEANGGYKKCNKQIELVSKDEFQDYVNKFLTASVALDKKTSNKLQYFVKVFGEDFDFPYLKSTEVRIAVLLELAQDKPLLECLKALRCRPSDPMRYAAAKVQFDYFKLPHDLKYANLTWQERVAIYTFLNIISFEDLCEEMGINRGAWSKFFMHTHLLSQKGFSKRFPTVSLAAYVSEGNRMQQCLWDLRERLNKFIDKGLVAVTDGGALAYRTFASRFMSAIASKDIVRIKEMVVKNPSYCFRNFQTVLNGVKKKDDAEFISIIREVLPRVDVGILLTLTTIDTSAKYRVIDVKGDTRVEDANYPEFFKDIQGDIARFINKKFGKPGKVEVVPSLKDKVVPFMSRNCELDRGTRYKVEDKYVYLFTHWVQDPYRRTDLDLSVLAINDDGGHEVLAFYRQANDYMKHSGDITDAPAPHGATEYARFDIRKLPKEVEYIVPCINSYSENPFDTNTVARAGFLSSNDSEFSLKRDVVQYNLTQPALFNVPFVYDVKKKEIVVLDYNSRNSGGRIAENWIEDVKKLISAVGTKQDLTIGKFAEMLSGDGKETSLTICNTKADKHINPVLPEELFSLLS